MEINKIPKLARNPLSCSLPNLNGEFISQHHIGENSSGNPNPSTGSNEPFIIGVTGGTASGKTSVCDLIHNQLNDHRVVIISQDSFYKSLTKKDLENVHDYNFDHPDSFDWDLLEQVLISIKKGESVNIPIYDFKTHSRTQETMKISGADVILLEGILSFYSSGVRDQMNMKVFVDTDPDVRLARRIQRDIRERGRDLEGVLFQYERFVKPAFDEYILPTKKYADVIIPRGADNHVAIDLIVQHIKSKLIELSLNKMRSKPKKQPLL